MSSPHVPFTFHHSRDHDDYHRPAKRRKMNTEPLARVGSHENPIDLDSDDSSDGIQNAQLVFRKADLDTRKYPDVPLRPTETLEVPDTPRYASPVQTLNHARDEEEDVWSVERVLDCVRDIFPDICPNFLNQQREIHAIDFPDGQLLMEAIVNRITEMTSYPRRTKKKLEIPTEPRPIAWGQPPWRGNAQMPGTYCQAAKVILSQELPHVNQAAIFEKLLSERSMYNVYTTFADPDRAEENRTSILKSNRRPPTQAAAQTYARALVLQAYHGKTLGQELEAAKLISQNREVAFKAQKEHASREAENEALATANGEMTECACCFTATPMNRAAVCDSQASTSHTFCYECTKKNAETTIGNGNCDPQCMDMSGCKALFAIEQLRLCLPAKTIDLIMRRQQLSEVKKAIPDLVECPFCDYMASCAPLEDDREFRCDYPECGLVSCRICREKTHIPLNCQEAKNQEKKLDHRHAVEEAMSEALVRTCNQCQNRFIKEDGCNKMRCTKCHNTQCYVCGENTTSYAHFGVGKCPVHDDYGVSVRHDDEVKKAEEAAKATIRAQNVHIDEDDLTVKVSAEVQKAEDERLKTAKSHGTRGNPADPYAHIRNPHQGIGDGALLAVRHQQQLQQEIQNQAMAQLEHHRRFGRLDREGRRWMPFIEHPQPAIGPGPIPGQPGGPPPNPQAAARTLPGRDNAPPVGPMEYHAPFRLLDHAPWADIPWPREPLLPGAFQRPEARPNLGRLPAFGEAVPHNRAAPQIHRGGRDAMEDEMNRLARELQQLRRQHREQAQPRRQHQRRQPGQQQPAQQQPAQQQPAQQQPVQPQTVQPQRQTVQPHPASQQPAAQEPARAPVLNFEELVQRADEYDDYIKRIIAEERETPEERRMRMEVDYHNFMRRMGARERLE